MIDDDEMSHASAELDVDLRYRHLANHFRIDENFNTRYTDRMYEYRVEGTEVSIRLIALKTEEIGEPEHFEVRDGVVLEMDIRTLAEGHSDFIRERAEEQIAYLKKEVEWQKMKPISWHGLKYFIISQKLPQPEVRRYLRQELERLEIRP